MAVIDDIKRGGSKTAFSFEVLPPVKGTGMKSVYSAIDQLVEYNPLYINITTHCSDITYKELPNGMYERKSLRRRPGTSAVAAAIHSRYDINVVPHILCGGFTKEETEYMLIDLQYLGITDLLVLRGDKARDESKFKPHQHGWTHALELEGQINDFNNGLFVDGSPIKADITPFHYGVACYPEKHEESPNMDRDLFWLKKKVEAGADYAVTQMFFDNNKYFNFLYVARQEGINIPIIPGIKPFYKLSQLNLIPKTFNVDLPQDLVNEAVKCKNDDEVRALGIEWCIAQCKELIAHGVPNIHFYTTGAVENVKEIAKAVF